MKKIILSSVSAAALLFAGSAFAAGNSSTIDQIGFANNAAVDQTGSPSDAVAQITQGLSATEATDEFNSASVTQGGGPGNQATITQSQGGAPAVTNPSNISNSNQQGANGVITVVQVGNDTSSISQLAGSTDEHALVGQSNNGNVSTISQGGASELALVNQEEGGGNSASITQSGTGNGVFTGVATGTGARGPGNLRWHENLPSDSVIPGASSGITEFGPVGAFIDQTTPDNTGAINQQGLDNFADVAQGNQDGPGNGNNVGLISQGAGLFFSDAVMYQDGQSNTAVINQSGAGSTYSTVWQSGNDNQAYSTQVGSEHSAIGQGIAGDFATFSTVNNDYASVDQTGGGDASTVTQMGDSDTALVSQFGANATSTVTQGGSFNTAVVHQ